MNINLTSQLKKWCDRRLHWLYTSASEVVREALRLMEEKEQVRAAKLEQLRNDIQEGVTAVRLRLGMRGYQTDRPDEGEGVLYQSLRIAQREESGSVHRNGSIAEHLPIVLALCSLPS